MQCQAFELQDEQDEADEEDLDEFEIECMLYSQLHYEQATDSHIIEDDNTQFLMDVEDVTSNGLDVNIETVHKNDKPTKTASSTPMSYPLGLPTSAIQHMIYRNKDEGSSCTCLVDKSKSRKRKLKTVSPNHASEDTVSISACNHGKSAKREKTERNSVAIEKTIVISSDSSSGRHGSRTRAFGKSSRDAITVDSESSVDDTQTRPYYGETVVIETDSVLEPNSSVISLSSSESDSWDDMASSDTNSSTDVPNIQVNFRQDGLPQRLKDGNKLQGDRQHDPDNWKINQQDRLGHVVGISGGRGSSRGRFGGAGLGGRYYRPSAVRCVNCNEVGHLSKDCPRPKKSQICIFCGYTGHFYRNCPQSLCYNCNQPGHTARLCEAPRHKLHWKCFRCDMLGHSHENCPDHWRQFHLTTTVKQPCPVRGQSDHTNKRRFCYNCGSNKHYGFECGRSRIDSHSMATYPLVARYDKRKVLKPLMFGDPDDVHSPSAAAKQTKLENKRRKKLEQKKSKSMNSSEYHCVNLKTTESAKLNSVHTFISRKVSAHVPVEWRTAKSAKKNKNSLKSRTLRKSEGSYTTFSDTGKPFKMGKKKRKKADNWRNKQTPGSSSRITPNRNGFKLSKSVRARMRK
ncbi:zinc finger CCHC domain-containing protein 7-like [Haliotis rufescens]|uniref:zinc finger CCHC domain-containing protein 7-like n=1 Tax=Haliotis rufescens TaxID=6454 RepID=UPI00201E8354|nr:zinc finger CCHC domain-containing protein 7-like [Haliotis rufescens]XP_046369977.2 zinc finger CCHC domain-containing protein 7-like [Haliotis rufescens]